MLLVKCSYMHQSFFRYDNNFYVHKLKPEKIEILRNVKNIIVNLKTVCCTIFFSRIYTQNCIFNIYICF